LTSLLLTGRAWLSSFFAKDMTSATTARVPCVVLTLGPPPLQVEEFGTLKDFIVLFGHCTKQYVVLGESQNLRGDEYNPVKALSSENLL